MVAAFDRRPPPSEQGFAKALRGKGATFLRALLVELIIRRELLPDGTAWLEDVEAERMVLYGMCAGETPPPGLDAGQFTYGYHKWLFAYLKRVAVRKHEALTTDMVVGLLVLHEHGEKALRDFPTAAERRQLLGPKRIADIEAIAEMGRRDPQMPFSFACKRVRDFAVKRRAHHRCMRLMVLLEQANADPKELWKEHRGIGELLTELTGSDGKVDGW